MEKVPPPRYQTKPTQPTYRKWQTSYPETARAKPALGQPCSSSSSDDDGGSDDDDYREGRFAPRQEVRSESPITAEKKSDIMTKGGAAHRSESSKQNLRRETIAPPPPPPPSPREQDNHRSPTTESLAALRLDEDPSSESGESFYSVSSTLPSQRRNVPLQQGHCVRKLLIPVVNHFGLF